MFDPRRRAARIRAVSRRVFSTTGRIDCGDMTEYFVAFNDEWVSDQAGFFQACLDQVSEESGRWLAWLKGETGRSIIAPSTVMSTISL